MSAAPHLDPESIELHAQGQGASAEHLAGCAECRGAVARAVGRRRLLGGLRAPELSDFAFARVERRLFDEKRPSTLERWLPALGLVAALALLVIIARLVNRPAPVPVAHPDVLHPAAPFRPLAEAAVMLVEGVVEQEAHGSWTPLDPGRTLGQNAHLRTGEGRLALRFRPGRGLVLEPHSELWLEMVVRGSERVSLVGGKVDCSTTPLTPEESFAVRAGPRFVTVVGTAFAVARSPGAISVEVEHGTVAVGASIADPNAVRVTGPGRLDAEDGAPMVAHPLPAEQASALKALPAWRWASGEVTGTARLDVIDLPLEALVQIDEDGWGAAPMTAWLPPGPHSLRARVPGEPERIANINLGDVPLTRLTLPKALAPSPKPPHHSPAVAPAMVAALKGVERSHHRELTYCYEHALKVNPTIAGDVVLHLTLTPDGDVEEPGATAENGAALPDELSRCILESVGGWHFPTGAPSEFELPLNLRAH